MVQKTYMAKKELVERKWHLVDASDQIVGRLATKLATILQGKHRPEYTPHVDTGDYIVVINAEKIRVTGANKMSQRVYKTYSGYPSGQKTTKMSDMIDAKPEVVIEEAVRRMMPKTKLGNAMMKKLKVVAGPEHKFQAQQPVALEL